MIRILWGIVALVTAAAAAQPGAKAQLVGTTVAGLSPKADVRLDLTGAERLRLQVGRTELLIPYAKVHSVEYGQNVSRRYAEAVIISPLLLLAKSRKHFVTLGYVDEEARQQAIVLRVAKGDIRAVLTGLETRTGRRVEYQDNEARKTGR